MGESQDSKLTVDNIIKFLTLSMILFLTVLVVISVITSKYDITGMVIVMTFIAALITLKWLMKEAGM